MISWKHSFKRLNEEYEMARKKRQALDNLLSTDRISPSTHELFNKEIDKTIAEIERQQKDLLENMNVKMQELEGQIRTLEMLLANFEIQHVTGEVDEDVYQREISILLFGLDTARQELDIVKEAVNQLSPSTQTPTVEPIQQKEEPQQPESVEPCPPKVEMVEVAVATAEEKAPEQPAENTETSEATPSQVQQESTPQVTQSTAESPPS